MSYKEDKKFSLDNFKEHYKSIRDIFLGYDRYCNTKSGQWLYVENNFSSYYRWKRLKGVIGLQPGGNIRTNDL